MQQHVHHGIKLNASICVHIFFKKSCVQILYVHLPRKPRAFCMDACVQPLYLSLPLYLHSSAILPGLGFVSQCLALATSRIPPVCVRMYGGVECGPNFEWVKPLFHHLCLFYCHCMHVWSDASCMGITVSQSPWTLIILQQGNLNPIHQGKGQELWQTMHASTL